MPNETAAPVLVLDDDPNVRHMIRWALEDDGFSVLLARDGLEGLDHARKQRPRLVVLDIGLPRLSGDGFAAELRGVYGTSVPILVFTADGRAQEKARRVGAFDFLEKPFKIDDLVAAVRRGLARP
jgi:DNA-binding response OmpR family regulator